MKEEQAKLLCDGLVQGGHLNARSISWKKNYAYIMTVFDRDPVDGTCFVNNAAVYGPEEWNQHQSVVAALQNMAQSLSRDEANK